MTALLAADIAYLPGPILAATDPAQAVAGLGAILSMGIALAAVLNEGPLQRHVEPAALVLIVVWVILLGMLFATGHGS